MLRPSPAALPRPFGQELAHFGGRNWSSGAGFDSSFAPPYWPTTAITTARLGIGAGRAGELPRSDPIYHGQYLNHFDAELANSYAIVIGLS